MLRGEAGVGGDSPSYGRNLLSTGTRRREVPKVGTLPTLTGHEHLNRTGVILVGFTIQPHTPAQIDFTLLTLQPQENGDERLSGYLEGDHAQPASQLMKGNAMRLLARGLAAELTGGAEEAEDWNLGKLEEHRR